MFVSKRLLIALVLLSFASCKKSIHEEQMVERLSDDTVKLSDEAVKNIKIDTVIKGEFPEKLSIMGKISVPEDRVAVVPARVAGRTDAVLVSSGEVVVPGQALASIFSADFSIAREEYIQAVEQARQSPKDEESKRLLNLSERKLNALGVSATDFEKWRRQGAGAELKNENLIVRAPRSGALLGKNAVVGNIVNVGDTLFMIGDMSKVWFAGDLYPEDLSKIHKNQDVVIEPGNGAPTLFGKVSFISPVIDPNTRTIKIRALVQNPQNQLRADMYVQGNVIISSHVAITAPKNSLIRLRDNLFCFKRTKGNSFKKVPVKVSSESGDKIAIESGLEDGDQVVSEGGLLLDAVLSGSGT
jgi:RND family efflux transporter MFP subunit